MAYRRNMAKGATMRMYYSPEQPQVRQTLALTANVMEPGGEPLADGDVTARITAPSGHVETVRLIAAGDEWGAFAGRFTAEEPGRHGVTLACKQTGHQLDTTFFVKGVELERIGRAARPEVLEEIARISRGRVIAVDRLEQIVESLASLPEPPPEVRRVRLWCHPAMGLLLVGLLGVFWAGRKALD